MIDERERYSRYKQTGVRWFPEIPEHWEVRRQRSVADLLVSNVDKHTVDSEIPVRLCNYTDVYKHDRISSALSFMRATASAAEIRKFRLRIGDVIITKDSETWNDIAVPALVSTEAPDLLCGYHLAILRAHPNLMLGAYLFRTLQATAIAAQYHVAANGVTRYGLSQSSMKDVLLPVPPVAEQALIVRFLEQADRRIQHYIRAKRRLIKLLEEQKQAIVYRAVTRGPHETVPLKPTDIDWLGDIPRHWDVLRCRNLFREIDERSAAGLEQHLSMSQRLGLVPSQEVESRTLVSESYAGGKLCKVGDLVLNRLKAHLGVFAVARHAGVISPDYSVFRPMDPEGIAYFEYVLRSPACRSELRSRARGIVEGFWRLYTDDFYDIRLPVPPVEERRAIVEFIRTAIGGVAQAIQGAEREISYLNELRSRLFADVVTGKLDIREAAARLPDIPDQNAAQAPLDEEVTSLDGDDAEAEAQDPELQEA